MRSPRYTAAAAASADPADQANWLGYAQAARAVPFKDYNERYMLQSARIRGRLHGLSARHAPADEAAALALLGQVYARPQYWRPALNAYRASLAARRRRGGTRRPTRQLREKHGFRITDFKVDSDAASPRVCFEFSEPLAARQGRFRALRRRLGRRQRGRHAPRAASSASTA